MVRHYRAFSFLLSIGCSFLGYAQSASSLLDGVSLDVEASATFSSGEYAPLWLSANRQGLVSPYANSAYERISVSRTLAPDSCRTWKRSFGVDVQLSQNSVSDLFVHQLYAEVQYKKAILTIGQKEREIDLRNNRLTSGGLSQGINARPIPEALLTVDYFSVPYTDHWWKMRFRGGFGMTTDGNWQESWVADRNTSRYTSNILYHEKALYWKFGREEKYPLNFEIGIQMQNQFGGTLYNPRGRGFEDNPEAVDVYKMDRGVGAFWHAFSPMGSSDASDGANANSAGNTLGSYNMALCWDEGTWRARAYFERFFEDQSLLTVQYGIFYDHLLGVDVMLPRNKYVSNVVVEHVGSTDQSGPVFHDATLNVPQALAGADNFYNHSLYSGWQHWGMSMGSPLLTSPIYNSNHLLYCFNNRVKAWHFGVDGNPNDEISWRVLATWTRNYGIYWMPLDDITDEFHGLVEANYCPRWSKGWSATLALALSDSRLMGNTTGVQFTVRKSFAFNK